MTFVPGKLRDDLLTGLDPEVPGKRISITTTSGLRFATCSRASRAELASPTTVNWGCVQSDFTKPMRTTFSDRPLKECVVIAMENYLR